MARILVAEDSGAILGAMKPLLEAEGHSVTGTDNGADALCLLSAGPRPELVILDLMMPVVDGYGVLKQLGASSPPIIVITGHDIDPGEFVGGPVARVLVKPFDGRQLIQAVNDVLAHGGGSGADQP